MGALLSRDRPLAIAVLFSLSLHAGVFFGWSYQPGVSRARPIPLMEVRLLRQLPEATAGAEANVTGSQPDAAGGGMVPEEPPEVSSSERMQQEPASSSVPGEEGPGDSETVPDKAGESREGLPSVEVTARPGGPKGWRGAAARLRVALGSSGSIPEGAEMVRSAVAGTAGPRGDRIVSLAGRNAMLRAPALAPPQISPSILEKIRRRIDEEKRYPILARKNGWEGEVVVEIRLGGEGDLQGVRLLRESGYPVLDRATIAAARRAVPYPPLAGRVAIPVAYRLTDD